MWGHQVLYFWVVMHYDIVIISPTTNDIVNQLNLFVSFSSSGSQLATKHVSGLVMIIIYYYYYVLLSPKSFLFIGYQHWRSLFQGTP